MQEELELSSEELAERTAEAETAERYSRGILESISDPFVVQDTEWRFRYVNEAASRIFSESNHGNADSLIGKSVWEEWPDIVGTKFEIEMRRDPSGDAELVECGLELGEGFRRAGGNPLNIAVPLGPQHRKTVRGGSGRLVRAILG